MQKRIRVFFALFVAGSLLLCVWAKNRHAPIDEWSSSLTKDKIEWAQASREYGVAASHYLLSDTDYDALIPLLQSVTEKISSRAEKSSQLEEGCRLAFHYDGKLWLFKCCENEVVSLMFEDAETGAYFGCEGKLLYIQSPELWHYIVNIVNENGI